MQSHPIVRLATLALLITVVWLASAELTWPARLMTTFLVGVLPVALIAQLAIAREMPDQVPRMALYTSSAIGIWVLAALALAAGLLGGFGWEPLGLTPMRLPALAAWSAAATIAGLLLMVLGRALRLRESPLLRHLLPRTSTERLAFTGLSFSAGIGEELVFRSFLIPALVVASGSTALAVVVSCIVFGLVHTYQNVTGVARAALLGFVLAVPFLATGSVLPSMVAHTALDLVAGLWLADWLLRR